MPIITAPTVISIKTNYNVESHDALGSVRDLSFIISTQRVRKTVSIMRYANSPSCSKINKQLFLRLFVLLYKFANTTVTSNTHPKVCFCLYDDDAGSLDRELVWARINSYLTFYLGNYK